MSKEKNRRKIKRKMEKIKELWTKHYEIICYGIFGVLTTIINYLSYIVCTRLFNLEALISNLIAWVLSVIFAFITNKLIVFHSKEFTLNILLKEGISFLLARVFSLLLDMLILYVMFDLMGINDLIVKIIANIVVIIVNYVLSKFMIFKKR